MIDGFAVTIAAFTLTINLFVLTINTITSTIEKYYLVIKSKNFFEKKY